MKNEAFGVGERLVYGVEFLGINAGSATMEIPEIAEIGDARAFRLIAESSTNSFFDKFYKVRNRYESFIDTRTLGSLKYVENQRENGAYRDRISLYNPRTLQATVTFFPVQKKGKPKNDAPPRVETVPIPAFAQDVLSAMFYLRTQKLEVGQVWKVPTVSGVKSYDLVVRVTRRKTVETPLGKFRTLELIPEIQYEGLFVHKGKSHVYVTDDERKIPVLLKSKVAIGSFKVELRQKSLGDLLAHETPDSALPPHGTPN